MNTVLDVAKSLEITGLTNKGSSQENYSWVENVVKSENISDELSHWEALEKEYTKENFNMESETKEFKFECDDDYLLTEMARHHKGKVKGTRKQKKSKVIRQCVCSKCNKIFNGQSALFYHNQTKHEEVTFDCIHCDYKASKTSHLKIHTERKHLNV